MFPPGITLRGSYYAGSQARPRGWTCSDNMSPGISLMSGAARQFLISLLLRRIGSFKTRACESSPPAVKSDILCLCLCLCPCSCVPVAEGRVVSSEGFLFAAVITIAASRHEYLPLAEPWSSAYGGSWSRWKQRRYGGMPQPTRRSQTGMLDVGCWILQLLRWMLRRY